MTHRTSSTDLALGRRAMALLEELAQHSDEPARLTRLYLSKAHRDAAEATLGFMQAAGLDSHIDPLGTVVGRLAGADPGRARAPHRLAYRHRRRCGPLRRHARRGARHRRRRGFARTGYHARPAPIEIVAFGDEENARFPTNLSTSYALVRPLRSDVARRDGSGRHRPSRRARRVRRRSRRGSPSLARDPARYRGYLEVHIEQGPQLEAEGLAVGIVSAINGISRARATVIGRGGSCRHGADADAPRRARGGRRDDRAIERTGATRLDTVATVGVDRRCSPAPSTSFRRASISPSMRARPTMWCGTPWCEDIVTECDAIAQKRRVALAIEPFMDSPATPMDPPDGPSRRSRSESDAASSGRARCGRHGDLARRHALRALQGRHQPQPGRIDHVEDADIAAHVDRDRQGPRMSDALARPPDTSLGNIVQGLRLQPGVLAPGSIEPARDRPSDGRRGDLGGLSGRTGGWLDRTDLRARNLAGQARDR